MASSKKTPLPIDAIRLFVGQIPKTLTADDLRQYFEEFGTILDVSIIRDKSSQNSKGCGFVTYSNRIEADAAIATLHDKKAIPPMTSTMQVSFAEGEAAKLEYKLFVGMVPKTATEDELKNVFAPYGHLDELYILKQPGPTKESRGCAFVKFQLKSQALAAMAAVSGNITMQGGRQPLVVKFAEKKPVGGEDMRGVSAGNTANPRPSYSHAGGSYAGGSYAGGSYAAAPPPPPPSVPMYPTSRPGPPPVVGGYPPQHTAFMSTPSSSYAYQPNGVPSPPSSRYGTSYPVAGGYGNGSAYPLYGQPAPPPPPPSYASVQYPSSAASGYSTSGRGAVGYQRPGPPPPPSHAVQAPSNGADHEAGPTGANLFVYGVDENCDERAMHELFGPFGRIVSAKVFRDKETGRSRGYGFVSYDRPMSAETAIAQLNGFVFRGKKLKVQHKRNESSSGPYSRR